MNKETSQGKAQQAKSKAKEKVGGISGDTPLAKKGKTEQVTGKAKGK